MPRRSTDFAGWQSEIEYLADEAERQNKAEASVALEKREAKIPYKRARLWQAALICFLTALALIAAFHWWLDGALRSIGL